MDCIDDGGDLIGDDQHVADVMPEDAQQQLIDWVCSLGLLRADGTPKSSWGAFVETLDSCCG